MELYDILEALMFICFGISWPINVTKSYKARTTKGKSLLFRCLILVGYVVGITSKFLNPTYMANFASKWYVLVFYIINFVFVSADVVVYWRNYRLDKANGVL